MPIPPCSKALAVRTEGRSDDVNIAGVWLLLGTIAITVQRDPSNTDKGPFYADSATSTLSHACRIEDPAGIIIGSEGAVFSLSVRIILYVGICLEGEHVRSLKGLNHTAHTAIVI